MKLFLGFLGVFIIVILFFWGLRWRSERNAERIGAVDLDLRHVTLASLEAKLGPDHSVSKPCRVSVSSSQQIVYSNCTSYVWNGVAEAWQADYGTEVSIVRVFEWFKGTLCGVTRAQALQSQEACGMFLAKEDGVTLVYRSPNFSLSSN